MLIFMIAQNTNIIKKLSVTIKAHIGIYIIMDFNKKKQKTKWNLSKTKSKT